MKIDAKAELREDMLEELNSILRELRAEHKEAMYNICMSGAAIIFDKKFIPLQEKDQI
ncbi:MAG TPA: hypothetical protein VIJ14_00130 [Rhabdochlamydiaceae bacterium]